MNKQIRKAAALEVARWRAAADRLQRDRDATKIAIRRARDDAWKSGFDAAVDRTNVYFTQEARRIIEPSLRAAGEEFVNAYAPELAGTIRRIVQSIDVSAGICNAGHWLDPVHLHHFDIRLTSKVLRLAVPGPR